MQQVLRFPCSPDQEEVIADHLLLGLSFGIQPDERAWILANVHKKHPHSRILSADLDLENAQWIVKVQT